MRKLLEPALWFALGSALTLLVTTFDITRSRSSLDESIQKMRGRHWVVIGHNPELEHNWEFHSGARGVRGEAAEDWTTVTYKSRDDAHAAVRQLINRR